MRSPRTWVIAGLLGGIFFLMGFLYSFQMPKARSWALMQIEQASREHLPMRILPSAVHLGVFPLGASLEGVRLIPKDEIKAYLDPVMVDRVELRLSWFYLLQGRLRLQSVLVKGTHPVVRVPPSEKKSEKPLEGFFKLLGQIPAQKLQLEDVGLSLTSDEPHVEAHIRGIELRAENQRGNLALEFSANSIHVAELDSTARVRVDVEAKVLLQPGGITVSALKVRRGQSFIVASGLMRGDTEALAFTDIDVSARTTLALESMRNWAVKTFPDYREIPALKGRASAEVTFARAGGKNDKVTFDFSTTDLYEDKIFLDRIAAKGVYENGVLRSPAVTVRNPAGSAALLDVVVNTGEKPTFSAKLKTDKIDLHQLLKDLGVGDIPVYAGFQGELPCSGETKPAFRFQCRGSLEGRDVVIKGDTKDKKNIVRLNAFSATGSVTVDAHAVSYQADLSMPNSKGRSSGVINYKTGFKIDYEAFKLALADVADLSGLKLEGQARIKGVTEGDSQSATATMSIDGSDMWLEDYWMGEVKSSAVSYRRGNLNFKDVQGHYATTRYLGDVSLDLRNGRIALSGRAPFIDVRDLLKAFARKVKLPVEVTGTGSAQIKVWGPLEFTALSYDLKSSLFRGTISKETYDQANFDVKSRNGEVATERVQLLKNNSSIVMTGVGHPNGQIKTLVKARGLRLEESNLIAATNLNLSGLVDFDMDMVGPVLAPETDLRGQITKASIGDQGVPDSHFRLKFTSSTIEGGGTFLGEVLKTDFVLPLNPDARFALSLRTVDWNFAPVFAAISGPATRKDYEGRLTSAINLSAPRGGFWASTGTIKASKFSMRRGPVMLSAPNRIEIIMNQGQIRVPSLYLEGDNTFFKVDDNPNPASPMDLQVNGKLDLNLIALMLPFFEDLRGVLSFAFNLRAGPDFSQLLGSAYIDRGYLKLFDFPHPFEEIKADVLFNQKKVLINSLRGDFAGGRFAADGTMELKGYKNYPLNIFAQIDNATMNVPEGFKTTGNATLAFSGSWFPFTMKGTYEAKSGSISKEFGDDDKAATGGVQRSSFLPELLLEESFTPLNMDVQVDFHRGLDIKNSQIEGRVSGNLNVKGNPSKPSLLGSVKTEPDTKVFFRDNTFEVVSANFQFTDPNEINPKMYLSGRSRVQEYDINLILRGTAQKPDIILTSQPPLPEQDIISLLALGITSERLDSGVASSQQSASSSFQVSSALLSKNPLGAELKKLGLELQISSGYDDTSSVAVQKISVSRQFNPKFGVTGTRSIGSEPKTDVKVRYRLTNRFSLIGSWEGQDYSETGSQADQESEGLDKFGLDLEYKFEFK